MVENGSSQSPPQVSVVRSGLAGKRVLITGVTGYLGMALFERLLSAFPDTRIVLLVRGRDSVTAGARAREILTLPVFEPGRRQHGLDALKQQFDERVEVLEGDLTTDLPAFPPDIDVVFHCAATVTFDPPIDEAFQTNILGANRVYEAIAASGSRPHLLHVSTAYVAGLSKGIVPEATLEHRVDWRTEAEAALGARRSVEEASRKPEMLDMFVAEARAQHGRAGPTAVARDAEDRRKKWVTKRLVHFGRARAQSLGWPDIYTFTKAMGERAVEELATTHGLPLSIVRPSIIESALVWPKPGWIEGFKMAEPIILAYGRGAIPEFPGIPEAVIDIIPIDLVANALLAIAVTVPSQADGHAYYHVCSGSRNPLSYRGLYSNVQEYFQHHPLPERGRGLVKVPTWQFPGRRRVDAQLRTGERLLDRADKMVSRLPRSDRVRSLVRQIDRTRGRVEFVRRYGDLYGAYAEIEVIYTDQRALALYRSLPPGDQAEFPFDAAVVDWKHYLQEVHCPSITMVLRYLAPERPAPEVNVRPSADDGVLAVFDMEGTLLDSNVIESYLWLRLAELPREEWPYEVAAVARKLRGYLGAERRDRGEFLRAFYRRYRGASAAGVRSLVDEHVGELLLQRLAPPAVRRIREHRTAGHRTILITGALDAFVRPLAPLFDEVVATSLAERDGRYTGDLRQPPLVGEARAAWLRSYARERGADLRRSYAYADSHSDLPLLRAVGNPVAVNPDIALYRVAHRHRWPVEKWQRSGGTPRVLLPEPAEVR